MPVLSPTIPASGTFEPKSKWSQNVTDICVSPAPSVLWKFAGSFATPGRDSSP